MRFKLCIQYNTVLIFEIPIHKFVIQELQPASSRNYQKSPWIIWSLTPVPCFLFFISYLAALRSTFGHWQRDSLLHQLFINYCGCLIWPEVIWGLITKLGSKSQPSTSGFGLEILWLWVNMLSHCNSPKICLNCLYMSM